MKKRFISIILLIVTFICVKDVYAFDSSNYKNRTLCSTFEVASFEANGNINKVSCHSTFSDAKSKMTSNGGANLAVMTKVGGVTKIVAANSALLDLSVNPETLTYFYTNSNLTGSSYTYMDTGSLYGGVDGALIDTVYSSTSGTYNAKVRIGNFTGWIKHTTYEIVPLSWVKSSSSYTVTSSDIRHNYVAKIQNTYSGSAGSTIGPKPTMLPAGKYYSYDGHYFYRDLATLIKDYKAGVYNNSVNKNDPYYNYYMYLSNHTKTAYSSTNIDEYIRNNLGYTKNVYGNSASNGTSRLYGSGTFFYYAQEKYGVNAILSLSLSRNETGNGRSNLAINKNNGFGLNAVDSNPTEAANWYPTFASSILGYSSKWATYGYLHPRDWRYFGPQFGDKWIGMNVKYASDTFWSEKMASNYYNFDKALGLQDYNYYQLGVVNGATNAYSNASTSSKFIYSYPEKEDAVVIVGETTSNGEKWYKVVSDLNIDSNFNEKTSGDYNWNGYVYVKASSVRKINTGKKGYVSPTSVYQYQDKTYTYDLYDSGAKHAPKVAITTKNTPYYYNSTLATKTGKTLLKDRYVMVYAAAYNNGIPVSYLVTSDYWHDQKEWVSADSLRFTADSYGKVSVTVSGNQYTWVNSNREDIKATLISGLYTNSYVPVLESTKVGSNTWYKVPVNLTGNTNVYGYTLASAPGVSISLSKAVLSNTKPVINASDKTIYVGDSFNPLAGVTATDAEDGNITNKITVTANTVNTNVAGTYQVTYKVVDSNSNSVTKTIKVTVLANTAPVINASDKTIYVGDTFNPLTGVTATDAEDGNITSKLKVTTNTVNINVAGTYKVVYSVTDSKNKTTTKEIKVIVKDVPVIDTNIDLNNINVTDLSNKSQEGEFYLEALTFNKSTKKFNISGYLTILNQDNTSDKKYYLVFANKNTGKASGVEITSWINNTPYDLGKVNGKSYTNSWFKGDINFGDIQNGDYDLYMIAKTSKSLTIQAVDNFFNQKITKRGEDTKHGYNFKVLSNLKSQKIELNIRDELYTVSEAPTYRTMINEFEDIQFKNNKLYIQGYSYNYNGTYNNQNSIVRKMIIENQSTYKQNIIDLGSAKGPYKLTTKDNLDKTYAWYEKEIDISNLDKGTYNIMVYTKTSNAEDYGELSDMFRELNKTTTINNKKYQITYNKDRSDRLEIVVY